MAIGSKINVGLSQFPEGVPKELFGHFFTIYNAIRNLANQLSLYAGVDGQTIDTWGQLSLDDTIFHGNLARWYPIQYEALGFGDCVSAILDVGEVKVRKANATDNTKPACGFVTSTDHVSIAGARCEVMVGTGYITGVGGMIAGIRYFLSTTDGLIQNTAPVAGGNIEQVMGLALASNRLFMNLNFDWKQH